MDYVAHPELKIVINWSFLKTEKHLHASESVTVPEISFRVLGASQLRVRRTDVASIWDSTHLAIYKHLCLFMLPRQLPVRANYARKDLILCLIFLFKAKVQNKLS